MKLFDLLPPPPWEGPPIPKFLLKKVASGTLSPSEVRALEISKKTGKAPKVRRTRDEYRELMPKVIELTKKGHTQREIAEELGVTTSYISNLLLDQTWRSFMEWVHSIPKDKPP